MKTRHFLIVFVPLLYYASATAQVDNCCFVDRQCHSDLDWINGFCAFQNGQCAAPSPSQPQASSQAASIAPAQIDNCCFAGWQCHSELDWMGGYHAYLDGRCAAPAQTPASVNPQPTSNTAGQVDNCCFTGWQCNSDQDWVNGYVAFQNGRCPASPNYQPGSADSCCELGWNCTIPSDWILGRWVIDDGFQCGVPIQFSVEGMILEGSEEFIARVIEALDLLKSKAPEWYAYVIKGPFKIREAFWDDVSGTLERSANIHPWHASQSIVPRARVLVHEACHVQRWLARLFRYETDLQVRTEENLCELAVDYMLDSIAPVRPHNEKLATEVNRLINEGVNIHELANAERQRAFHLLATIS